MSKTAKTVLVVGAAGAALYFFVPSVRNWLRQLAAPPGTRAVAPPAPEITVDQLLAMR
jgi:hypothetical protein